MLWCRTGDMPLYEQMIVSFTDAYVHHSAWKNSQAIETLCTREVYEFFLLFLVRSCTSVYVAWWRHMASSILVLIGWVHDNFINWKPYLRYWPFVRGIHRSQVDSPNKDQWRGALMFSLICLNKRLSKQSGRRWFETLLRSLWRHCNGNALLPEGTKALFQPNLRVVINWKIISEIRLKLQPSSVKKLHLKMPSTKWRPSCFGLRNCTGKMYASSYVFITRLIAAGKQNNGHF